MGKRKSVNPERTHVAFRIDGKKTTIRIPKKRLSSGYLSDRPLSEIKDLLAFRFYLATSLGLPISAKKQEIRDKLQQCREEKVHLDNVFYGALIHLGWILSDGTWIGSQKSQSS